LTMMASAPLQNPQGVSTSPLPQVIAPQNGGGGPKPKKILSGGEIVRIIDKNDQVAVYQKLFILAFMFFVAVYCASVTFMSQKVQKDVLKLKGEEESPDPNFDSEDETNITRWRRIMQMIIVFTLLVITYFIAMIVVVVIMLAIYFSIAKKENEKLWDLIKPLLLKWFWITPIGTQMSFYGICLGILFGGMLVFMIYHLAVKSYIPNIAYPAVVNTEQTENPELRNPVKFIMYYGLYVMLLFAFFLVLYSFYHLTGNVLLVPCLLFIVILMMFVMLIYRYTMEQSKKFRILILWLAFLGWTFCSYFIMTNLAEATDAAARDIKRMTKIVEK
jgi:hypothetical protein